MKSPLVCHTPDDVARMLHVNRRTVYQWIYNQQLRGVKAGDSWRVLDEDLRAFLQPPPKASPRGPKPMVKPAARAARR